MTTDDWKTEHLHDMTDKTIVVTGANSGLGYEATRIFAQHGATVIMACRDVNRAEAAMGELLMELPDATLDIGELDLADSASIRSFADDFRADYADLHVLCNNAGAIATTRTETEDGFETQFGVNHLGHFALTGRLLPHLRDTDGESRVVTQSSGIHEHGDIDFEDLQSEYEYNQWTAYAQCKLANVLFAYELQRRLDANDIVGVTSVACHPGYAATNFLRRGPEQREERLWLWVVRAANAILAQSAEMGALPLCYAAIAPEIDGGEYVGPGGLLNIRGTPEIQRSSELSYDETLASRLWEVSEDLSGVRYDFSAPITVSE